MSQILRRGRRWSSTLTVLALSLTGISLAGTDPARAAGEGPAPIEAGAGLDWGVKASFRSYTIGSIANGAISVADGATRNGDGTFHFPVAGGSYDPATKATTVEFEGAVRFAGHDGLMDLTIIDPVVTLTGDESVLTADVRSREMTEDAEIIDYPGVALAELDIAGVTPAVDATTTTWATIPAALAEDGAGAFAGFYQPGTSLDPVTFGYQGDGGKPAPTQESWTAPGSPLFEVVARKTVTAAIGVGSLALGRDDDVWVGGYGALEGSATLLDPDTLDTVASVELPTNSRKIAASRTDGTAYSIDNGVAAITRGPDGTVSSQQVWGGAGYTNALEVRPTDGALLTITGSTLHVVEHAESGFEDHPYEIGTGYGTAAVDDDGTVYLLPVSTEKAVARVAFDDDTAVVTPLDEDAPTAGALNMLSMIGQDGTVASSFQTVDLSNYPPTIKYLRELRVLRPAEGGGYDTTSVAADNLGSIAGAVSPDGETVFVAASDNSSLLVVRGGAVVATVPGNGLLNGVAASSDGDVYTSSRSGAVSLIRQTAVSPTVTTQPASRSVEVTAGGSAQVTFAAAAGGDPAPTVQWQVRAPGSSRFTDLAGATGTELTVTATTGSAGAAYRAVFSNRAGSLASDAATLGVSWAPSITLDTRSQTVTEGTDAVFVVSATANPEPAVVWQRQVDGFWQAITADDDDFAVSSAEGASSLTVRSSNTAMSGTRLRARLRNDAGTTFSRVVTLTVNPKKVVPAQGLDLTGATFEWAGSEEMQAAPPYGGSNYFSAGVSDGSEASYRATDGDVSIVHATADGAETPASYATRAAQTDGSVTQLVRFSDGKAHLAADGSAEVAWDGDWSVNFYGGLVPFTVSDPVLTVDADGDGTLTADLAGYASDMAHPTEKTPLPPVADVTIATFEGVRIDPAGAVSVDPDYEGVRVAVPSDVDQQSTTGTGWGAWPQELVDFQVATGLSSYWYSSGRESDARKAPAVFTVDLTDAAEVEAPPTGPDTGAGTPPAPGPLRLAAPRLKGKPRIGGTLTAVVALPAGVARPAVVYRWYAGTRLLKDVHGRTLKLGKGRAKRVKGKRIQVRVTVTASGYLPTTVVSARTRKVTR